MKIIFLFVIFFSIEAASNDKKCRLEVAAKCLMDRHKFIKDYGTVLPTNEKELIGQCRALEELRNCLYNFSQNCQTSMDRIVMEFSFSGTGKNMEDFCNPDEQFYKNYLQEAECIKNNIGVWSSCFKDNLASYEYALEDTSGSKFLIFCCGLRRLRSCVSDNFQSACSSTVADLMKMQVEFVFSEWIVEMCLLYAESETCPTLPTGDDLKRTYKPGYFANYIEAFTQN
ncbi:uncharacterized protein LOC111629320 [Centruroides sculpturatus]|uniref:uncharacterized protein LOC111629320 n=1 Tax=Centruroides sculpturatus TaxID=218467 RepID=UPI000C6CA1CA|nr:uncharacterized protein LOC111629320 [Centruroides sculpturatus]